MQCCPEKAETDDQNQSAHPCLSAKMKTPARLRIGHGKSTMADFFKRKMWLEKKHQEVLMTNYTLRF